VVESDFRYPGPKPQIPETAIVMIADSVQAISQQMPEPTPARLKEMIHEVTMKRLLDGQFDECGLTFRELRVIEEAFLQALVGIFHTRPAYPKGRPNPADLAQPREMRFPRGSGRDEPRKPAAKRTGTSAAGTGPVSRHGASARGDGAGSS
jgi:hypothetical protein